MSATDVAQELVEVEGQDSNLGRVAGEVLETALDACPELGEVSQLGSLLGMVRAQVGQSELDTEQEDFLVLVETG